ncbi:MAG: hypothetical protein FWD31_07190 [Planctomycetaceae bacterium]|nr:hypothetical protein [Planctomycetaceae bacterium]
MSNPYAYYEESLPIRQAEIRFRESADTGEGTSHEPRVPIVVSLKRGLFGGRMTLETDGNRCEISGASLGKPIVVPREEAVDLMQLKSHKLIVRTKRELGDPQRAGRKYVFRFGRDKHWELALARLETWRRQRWHDAAGPAYEMVSDLLKKNVIRPLLHNVIVLTVLQSIVVLLIVLSLFVTIQPASEVVLFALVGVLMYGIPPMVTFALAVALGMRQIWAVYMTLILSFVPLGLSILAFAFLLSFNITAVGGTLIVLLFPILLALAIIGSSIRVIVRYNSQRAAMEYDNRIPTSGRP